MTARQRALREGETLAPPLLALPMGAAPVKKVALSEDDEAKLQEKVQKRKLREQQRAQELMETTIQGLLKKQASRKLTEEEERQEKLRRERSAGVHVRYVSSAAGASLSLPTGMAFPLPATRLQGYPPPRPKCAAPDCPNPRRYACAATHQSICSLECLRKLSVVHSS